MSTILSAFLGAIAGVLLAMLGLRFHIGSWFLDGVAGTIAAALAGAVMAVIVRLAIRRQYGL